MSTANLKRRMRLRMTGLIIGFVGVSLCTYGLLAGVLFGPGNLLSILGTVVAPGLFLFGSLAIAWKWERIGSVLLILEGLVPIGFSLWLIGVFGSSSLTLGLRSFFIGLPLPVSGILLLLSWREGRKHAVSMSKPE